MESCCCCCCCCCWMHGCPGRGSVESHYGSMAARVKLSEDENIFWFMHNRPRFVAKTSFPSVDAQIPPKRSELLCGDPLRCTDPRHHDLSSNWKQMHRRNVSTMESCRIVGILLELCWRGGLLCAICQEEQMIIGLRKYIISSDWDVQSTAKLPALLLTIHLRQTIDKRPYN